MPSDRWGEHDPGPSPAPRSRYGEQIAPDPTTARRRRRVVLPAVVVLVVAGAATAFAVGWPDGAHHNAPSGVPQAGSDPAAASSPAAGGVTGSANGAPPYAPSARAATGTASAAEAPSAGGVPVPSAAGAGSLSGRTIVIDPGHNPGNSRHTAQINQKVNAGGLRKECDTTGTETNAGYSEAQFTVDVARRARELLRAQGAEVVFTWESESWGPCVDVRARRGNEVHADAAVSIHGDGAAASGRGFHVITPGALSSGAAHTAPIVQPSHQLGEALVGDFARETQTRPSSYLPTNSGLVTRTDLGGLNLSTVPKVFIECGNMRNSNDAALMTNPDWRERAARGIAQGITDYLLHSS